jgi:hypothetical protein
MKNSFLHTVEDMAWLLSVHLKNYKLPEARSADVIGNEDAPKEVRVYSRRNPRYTDNYILFIANDEGNLVLQGAKKGFTLK